jgi:hypothetical protein
MNRDERRRRKRTVRKDDARTGETSRAQTVTSPSRDGVEESPPDLDHDEGGEA